MIYLTFDTNILIYSLDGSWKFDNHLDYLEPWIAEGYVKLLLPEVIFYEWDKNREAQVVNRKKQLKDFFEIGEEILPSAFFSEFTSPTTQEYIIGLQLNRIKNLIGNAQRIALTDDIRDKTLLRGISKLAPMGNGKNNTADTIITLSLIDFANKNPGHQYYFISNNTFDFFKKNDKNDYEIHPDLKEDFENNGISAYRNLDKLIADLKLSGLPVAPDFAKRRKDRIRNKIKEKAYNPEYEKLVEGGHTSFISNMETVEFILQKTNPTKEQIMFVLALIDTDADYEKEFYQKLTNPIWFKILRQKGAFKVETIPSMVSTGEGDSYSTWLPLLYFKTLAKEMLHGKNIELARDIVSILENATQKAPMNWRLSYFVLQILSDIPNQEISKQTLGLIPKWFSAPYDKSIQTRELCTKILPKFLNDASSVEDIAKAKQILEYLLSVVKRDKNTESLATEDSYGSMFDLRDLKMGFSESLIVQIVKRLGETMLDYLAETLKLLFTDYPGGINIAIHTPAGEHHIKVVKEGNDITLLIANVHSENIIARVQDYESLSQNDLEEKIASVLKENNIVAAVNDENRERIKRIPFQLFNDVRFTYFNKSIEKLDDDVNYSNQAIIHLVVIFRDMLREIVKQDNQQGIKMLQRLLNEKRFRMPFFKRMAMFIIRDNWELGSNLWWKYAKENPKIFTTHVLQPDILTLLHKNQQSLSSSDLRFLDNPMQDVQNDALEKWRLRWFSTLRNLQGFQEKYEAQAKKMGIAPNEERTGINSDEDFEAYLIQPLSKEDLLRFPNHWIASKIRKFRPKNNWEGLTTEGLARALSDAVTEDPERFIRDITLFDEIQYPYAYYIIHGFTEAWKKEKKFDWSILLKYCHQYLVSKLFGTEQLYVNEYDGRSFPDWIIGGMADLITEGTQADENAFSIELLPQAKDLLQLLAGMLKEEDVEQMEGRDIDYSMLAVNSTSGKVFRAIVELSLRKARTAPAHTGWDPELRNLYENLMSRGFISASIIKGMYFHQFLYLDKTWIIDLTRNLCNENEQSLKAFMGGFSIGNPPSGLELYELFSPLYSKIIGSDLNLVGYHNNGIIRHIVAFYFWGYETLEDRKLIFQIINQKDTATINTMVNFISAQSDYANALENDERQKFERSILSLWQCLLDKYHGINGKHEETIVSDLLWFIVFVVSLNDTTTDMIIKSVPPVPKYFDVGDWINELHRLKQEGPPAVNAVHIGKILYALPHQHYLSDAEKDSIANLVIFLYENAQKTAADNFCERLRRNQISFLDPIFKQYNR